MKVYWLSRHEFSPAQWRAIRDLHGDDVQVVHEKLTLEGLDGLADYIRGHGDGFVYAVAGAAHYVRAALAGSSFGVFENHPQKRADGSFGLAAVYHVGGGEIRRVWVNPDPLSDQGESLIPVVR